MDVRLRTNAMIYDLLEPRYRAIVSKEMYDLYMATKSKYVFHGNRYWFLSKAEVQHQELQLRMTAFDPRRRASILSRALAV